MQIECPECHAKITPELSEIARVFGSVGGRVTGSSKARTPEQARHAALVGAEKRRRQAGFAREARNAKRREKRRGDQTL